MGAIIDFFSSIVDTIVSVIDFVISLVSDLFTIITLLADTLLAIPYLIGWLPSTAIAVVVATFAVVVIYKFTGRD